MAGPSARSSVACKADVLTVFPDICLDFLGTLVEEKSNDSDAAVSHIADLLDSGKGYPKRPQKRKREPDEDEAVDDATRLSRRFCSEERRKAAKHPEYIKAAKTALCHEFTLVPAKTLYTLLQENDNCLLPTLESTHKILKLAGDGRPPFALKKKPSKQDSRFHEEILDSSIQEANADCRDAFEEYKAYRRICRLNMIQEESERQKMQSEEENLARAQAEGTMMECGCCYDDLAMNRMVHCNGDVPHYFCKDCARTNAETQVGLSKYHLDCMSTDGCSASFSLTQRCQFLDDKLRIALERIEQEDVLRQAGIENLETCPFCPYAAEYPPVEENKEFRCVNPDCEIVSCRLCRETTHIPLTCQEAIKENGCSARRNIEEAMSAALIRRCNKCQTPFIKEHGCNKMMCTRGGCHAIQCYVCHQTVDGYGHFNDPGRGGKKGNCPLFDDLEKRHEDEVREAEEKARNEAAAANPDVAQDVLKINFSDQVKQDDERRKKAAPQPPRAPIYGDVPDLLDFLARQEREFMAEERAAVNLAFHPGYLYGAAGGRAARHVPVPPPIANAARPPPADAPRYEPPQQAVRPDDMFGYVNGWHPPMPPMPPMPMWQPPAQQAFQMLADGLARRPARPPIVRVNEAQLHVAQPPAPRAAADPPLNQRPGREGPKNHAPALPEKPEKRLVGVAEQAKLRVKRERDMANYNLTVAIAASGFPKKAEKLDAPVPHRAAQARLGSRALPIDLDGPFVGNGFYAGLHDPFQPLGRAVAPGGKGKSVAAPAPAVPALGPQAALPRAGQPGNDQAADRNRKNLATLARAEAAEARAVQRLHRDHHHRHAALPSHRVGNPSSRPPPPAL